MVVQALLLAGVGLMAGILGALLGLGGGIIITPVLTLMLGLPIQYAIAASIVAVIATSSGATIAYLKDDMLNLRVAMFLEIATTIGAVLGAILTGLFNANILYFLFGALLLFSVYNMIRKMLMKPENIKAPVPDQAAEKLNLNGQYFDKSTGQRIDYQVTNVPGGFAMMFGAGLASGLLGIGSGAFKVLAMDTIMKMPLKPSTATSNLMMGVTAAASATVYFFNGSLQPQIAAPLAIGILIGATLGTRLMQIMPTKVLRWIFIPVIGYMGLQMLLKGFGVNIG
ncbi:permease [Lacticaseibacillus camelliae DSM 22697 = JCM 13995]|uniref:Probable membrane transporter protein n=1 Tax=Lacticaseibacillus camelliae DSM 22697 = JCM 13995 TaxID=1423730 RepID=A0A0R2F032_9LACO|nr:permease [Lacticaseibacillus camelliae DSM 22697 = JCM 13995]